MTIKAGEKQPAHSTPTQEAQETVQKLDKLRSDLNVETYKPSLERQKQPGNPNKTPPHERHPAPGPAQTAAADLAAGFISGAKTAIETQETTEARLKSDPRYDRDQRVYEMARTGAIGLVPPSKLELASQGATEAEVNAAPQTPQEQVADDMKRLDAAQEIKDSGASAVVPVAGHSPVPNQVQQKQEDKKTEEKK